MYIKVRVTAGAKKELFEEKGKDHFAVQVKEKAERNMANTRVRELVAEHYNISPKQVRIISGHTTQSKILSIHEE